MEIERKWIVKDISELASYPKSISEIEQYYTQVDSAQQVRYRKVSNDSELLFFRTIKSGNGLVRKETEEKVSESTYYDNIKKKVGRFIRKIRSTYFNGKYKIEVDSFLSPLEYHGLLLMEIEFSSKEEAELFNLKETLGLSALYKNSVEVTDDSKYSNKYIAVPKK